MMHNTIFWYMYSRCNEQIKVISIIVTSKKFPFFVVRTFKIFSTIWFEIYNKSSFLVITLLCYRTLEVILMEIVYELTTLFLCCPRLYAASDLLTPILLSTWKWTILVFCVLGLISVNLNTQQTHSRVHTQWKYSQYAEKTSALPASTIHNSQDTESK